LRAGLRPRARYKPPKRLIIKQIAKLFGFKKR
jgi:hypothetical protein